MKIECAHSEVVDIETLVPNPKNPNKHGEKQIKLLAKIMAHQGWRHPVTVSKRSGFVVTGHGRIEAARLNGWDRIPIDRQEFANEADEYAHMIADNKIAELAEHDDAMMMRDVLDLGEMDYDFLGIPEFTPIVPTSVDFPDLETDDPDIQQVTFVLSNEQKDLLDEAMQKASREEDCIDEINTNKNGNIISAILRRYVYG